LRLCRQSKSFRAKFIAPHRDRQCPHELSNRKSPSGPL
jgi:hypothetical protein